MNLQLLIANAFLLQLKPVLVLNEDEKRGIIAGVSYL